MSEKQKWPAQKVVQRKREKLAVFANNSRTHSEEQVHQIARSIEQWGWTTPVLIDENDTIIAGHGRVLAAEVLAIDSIPCLVAKDWTEEQKRSYVIADNKLAENADWDLDILASELGSLGDFDLSLTGFGEQELTEILHRGNDGLRDPDEELTTPDQSFSVIGDVWVMGEHRLRCGSSTEADDVADLLDGEKPHLMVTDPPYGVEYDAAWRNKVTMIKGEKAGAHGTLATGKVLNDDTSDWSAAYSLFPGDVAYVWHSDRFASIFAESLENCGFVIRNQIIWAKSQMLIGRGDYHFKHEPCLYAVRKGKKGHWQGSRKETTLWEIDKPRKSETSHSTQKPVECMRRPIINNSRAGDSVYEPFSGSGTTIIAGEMEGRRVFAMELNPPYVDMAVLRWQSFTGHEAIHRDTGKTFSQIKEERKKAA